MNKMTVGLLYECRWARMGYSSIEPQGWDLLLFIGIEAIHRTDGVVIENYRFHDLVNNESVLTDKGLIRYCKEIKGDYHECD